MRISKNPQIKGGLLSALCTTVLLTVTGQGTAHAAPKPMVSTQASPSGFPAGGKIFDSAMLGYGVNPTGLLTFELFGPEDPMCEGTPLFVTTTAVAGNGYYESSRYTTDAAGDYRWTVVYGGDANNIPSPETLCSDPGAVVSVSKRVPLLNASASWVLPSATDTAVLTMGSGPAGPTGTMTFNLYGPANMTCAGPPIFTTTRVVAGNGSYPSAAFDPILAGTYQWVVQYSGDANNAARSTICSDTINGFTATIATPAIVTALPSSILRGGTATVAWSSITSPTAGDWVALYKVGTPDGGAVTAWKYTMGTASGSVGLKFPWGAAPGFYEVRLMANNNIQRLATSLPVLLVW